VLVLGAFIFSFSRAPAQDAGAPTPPPHLLTTARELRALTAEQAKAPYPVHLRATVTLAEPGGTAFLRDETGATFTRAGSKFRVRSGQRIEVEGDTFPGLYLSGIVPKKITVLSEGEPPIPLALNFEQLASGQFHYDWVEVRGIVRSVTETPDYILLKLALGNGALDVYPMDLKEKLPVPLVDAEVRVVGIAAGFINDRRQLVAPHLRIRSLADVTVLEPALADPSTLPVTPAAELLRFAPGGRAGHRVQVRGTVMHQDVGRAVFLRDASQGLRVRTTSSEIFAPGEVVTALGFPTMGTFSAELDDATLQHTGETADLLPVPATMKDLLSGKRDADLVQVEASVRDVVREADRLTIILESGETVFPALLHPCPADTEAPAKGAVVRVRGVCRVAGTTQPARSYSTQARSFELLLHSPTADIDILQSPPWWTAQRLAIAASILLALALLALTWVALLRRQVRRQMALIREQVETVAVADERQRIAREFHDTLEQELVGVSLRLDAATTRAAEPKLRDLLTATRRLVHQLQTGARSFVWNLRDTSLAGQPLAAAISAALTNLTAGRQLEVRTLGEPRRLPETIGHELLRVAQEATTNAIKHGQAQQLTITLDYAGDSVRLTVQDDGAGFDPAAPVPAGHFGLIGMRERVQKLGGEFALRSTPSGGTTVEIKVPLEPRSSAGPDRAV